MSLFIRSVSLIFRSREPVVKLGKVAVKVGFADVVVRSVDGPL